MSPGWLAPDALIGGAGYLRLMFATCTIFAALLWVAEKGKSGLCRPEESGSPA